MVSDSSLLAWWVSLAHLTGAERDWRHINYLDVEAPLAIHKLEALPCFRRDNGPE